MIFLFGGYLRLFNYYITITKLKKEIAIIKAENEVLRLRIERYRQDTDVIERFARDRLGMKKPNESIIIIFPNDN